MGNTNFNITEIKTEDKSLVASFISDNWGSPLIVTRGKIYNSADLYGFVYKENDRIIGLITCKIENDDCEIVSLNSKLENKGLGTSLINKVIDYSKINKCKRVWLITTNDNTNAIRFYQKRGFEWAGFYKNAIMESRKLKPEISEFGIDNIPIKHEIEFELSSGNTGLIRS
jgi:GNAT superfamily N-acetyltransferase